MRDPQAVVEVSSDILQAVVKVSSYNLANMIQKESRNPPSTSDILANMIQEESLHQPSIYCVSKIQTEFTEKFRGVVLD